MRSSKSRIVAVLSGCLLSLAAAVAAFADDTEIFFNQNGTDIPANVMFIMDTSGSMNELVTTQAPYDPAKAYTADKCGTAFDSTAYYYIHKGLPTWGFANKLPKNQFKCTIMLLPVASIGLALVTVTRRR